MMVKRYPNLKEEVGGSIPGCEISSLLDRIAGQVVNCLMCFGASVSAFCLKRKKKESVAHVNYFHSNLPPTIIGQFMKLVLSHWLFTKRINSLF